MKKVLVAMSGGVDSSVAAALLKKRGYNVVGIFMKFWSGSGSENRCCSSESEVRARLVAKQLNIPFYVLNFEKEFKNKIVDYFLKEEKAGLTPNPCVVCNKEIKFGLLFKKFPMGANDFIATGHYVKTKEGRLYASKDKSKDQSYFLWKLDRKILSKSLFPVGDYTKVEIRKMAKKLNLPTATIPDSQEVCFIEKTTKEFLKKHLKTKPGKIVFKGDTIGKHEGLWLYTIGQRRGIGLAGGPYYVLNKDMKKNLLIVTKDEKDLFSKEVNFKDVNWFKEVKFPLRVKAKIRYSHKASAAVIDKRGHLVFVKPQKAITSGQSVVFYKRDELIGGGVII